MDTSNVNSMFLNKIEDREILDIVKNFKSKKSTDTYDIDMTIIKNTIPQIVKPLIYLFNKSFETGQFPNMMKKAKIIPIFKSGDKNTFTDYRPVSLLPQFSKILEKTISN